MLKDLQTQVLQLANMYQHGSRGKKHGKLLKAEEKDDKKTRAVEVYLKPQYFLNPNKVFHSNHGLITLAQPEIEGETSLGEIASQYESYTTKVQLAQYNFYHKYVAVQLELINITHIPIEFIKKLYVSFQNVETHRTVGILDTIGKNDYKSAVNSNPMLFEPNWADLMLEGEELPTSLFRLQIEGDKPRLEFVYNQNFMKLIGVMPNILIDAILQSQRLPQILIEKELKLWNEKVQAFIECHQQPVIKEFQTLAQTYEGMKVGVRVRETYISSFSADQGKHILLQKTQYMISNPKMYQIIFDQQRICKNSIDYLYANKISDSNRKLNNQLAFETNTDMQAKYKLMKPCGYKTKE